MARHMMRRVTDCFCPNTEPIFHEIYHEIKRYVYRYVIENKRYRIIILITIIQKEGIKYKKTRSNNFEKKSKGKMRRLEIVCSALLMYYYFEQYTLVAFYRN